MTGIGGSEGVYGAEGEAGILYGRLDYSIPLGYTGTRFGLYASVMEYKLGEELEDLEAGGASQAAGLWFSRPFIRSRLLNLWMDAGFEAKNISQDIFDEEVNKDRVRSAWLGATLQKVDNLISGGFTTVDVRAFQGFSRILDGQASDDPDFIRLETDIVFTKFLGTVTRVQRFPYGVLAILSATGQYSSSRLPSSEQLHIGGAGTVRGYSQSEYSGDKGYFGTIELRVPLINTDKLALQLAAFADYGRVLINDKLPGEDELDGVHIAGAGAGIRFTFTPYLKLQVDWAKHIGGEVPLDDEADSKGVWYFQLIISY